MNYTVIKALPDVQAIMNALPLTDENRTKVNQDRQDIKRILSGEDNRMIMIVGPCSAWPESAVMNYAQKLQALNMEYADVMKIIMRVYTQKSRTGTGWLGPYNQPDPFQDADLEKGLIYARRMMIDVINLGLPISAETVFTHYAKPWTELLSWMAIGARSTENQEHRILASSMNYAVGLKNPTHGSISIGVNSVVSAQHSHVAVFDHQVIKTHGNPFAHLVLRGSHKQPNYSIEHLRAAREMLASSHVNHPAIIIDASHDNCFHNGQKDHRRQSNVIIDTLDAMKNDTDIQKLVKGFMLESFIKAGNQKIEDQDCVDFDGLSITDPCLDWDQTASLLHTMAERLRQ